MYKLFLSAFIFIFCPLNAFAALCVENNVLKCDDLGYTESACPYGGIACPFDISRWYCATWTCDDGRYKDKPGINDDCLEVEYKDMSCLDCVPAVCEIGSVYYADGSCGFAENYDGSKIPIGVVFEADEEGKHGKIVNLNFLTLSDTDYRFNPEDPYGEKINGISWGPFATDVTDLTNYKTTELINNGLKNRDEQLLNGKKNTTFIAETIAKYSPCVNGTYEKGTKQYANYCDSMATKAALSFYPPGTAKDDPETGVGNWYIPAFGELLSMRGYDFETLTASTKTLSILNKTLNILANKGINATPLINISQGSSWYYLNATEMESNRYMSFNMNGGHWIPFNKFAGSYVRVVLMF